MEVNYFEGNIREYDLSAANVSVLVENGYISEDMYYDLMESKKTYRNKIIGKLILNNPEVYEILRSGIEGYVNEFIDINKLAKSNILEISKDAIFTIDIKGTQEKKLKLSFGDFINFIPKHNYLSMFEFTPKDTSNTKIKIYLVMGENKIEIRYAKLDDCNPMYDMLVDLMRFRYDGNNHKYLQKLREMVVYYKKTNCEDVCSGCTNDRLIDAFRELATL